jgi:hypothetical protein
MKTAEEIEKALDELMIARGEHQTRVRNPLYGEERELAIALAKWAVADYKERLGAALIKLGYSDLLELMDDIADTTN